MTEVTTQFALLFQGRTDAWGAVEGRSVKEPITAALIADHLYGEGSVGVYPLLDNGTVRWGCIDLDEGYDLIAIAINLQKALRALDLSSWVERTKGKGFHIWTFYDDWLPAPLVVNAQRVACDLVGYRPKEGGARQAGGDRPGPPDPLPADAGGVRGEGHGHSELSGGRRGGCRPVQAAPAPRGGTDRSAER